MRCPRRPRAFPSLPSITSKSSTQQKQPLLLHGTRRGEADRAATHALLNDPAEIACHQFPALELSSSFRTPQQKYQKQRGPLQKEIDTKIGCTDLLTTLTNLTKLNRRTTWHHAKRSLSILSFFLSFSTMQAPSSLARNLHANYTSTSLLTFF